MHSPVSRTHQEAQQQRQQQQQRNPIRKQSWSVIELPSNFVNKFGVIACTLCINKCAALLNMQMQVLKKTNLYYILPLSEVLNELQINC